MKKSRFTEEQIIGILKPLRDENMRLRKLVADLSLSALYKQDVRVNSDLKFGDL